MNDSIALFGKILVLAAVDWEQANNLAVDSGLIVKSREGTVGVLTGVTHIGRPEIRVHQRTAVWTHLEFDEVTATGHRWEVSA
jgi:hypothetical protein